MESHARTSPKTLPQRAHDWLVWQAGPALSLVGERLNIDALIYNPLLYFSFDELGKRNAPGVIGAIDTTFPSAQRYLDVGAGTGAFAAEAARRGKTAAGCEYSAHGRRYAAKRGIDLHPFDLTRDPPADITERFDLAYSFEVAEHLTPEIGVRLVQFLVARAPLIVFSAAQPGQIGAGHINEQPKSYWIDRFGEAGATHNAKTSDSLSSAFGRANVSSWFEQNAIVFNATGARS